MNITLENYTISNLSKYNIILGKNGCGKSSLLRKLDKSTAPWTHKKYISPERGGVTQIDPNIENSISENANWLANSRRSNFDDRFRQKSMAQLKNLELLINRGILGDPDRRASGELFDDTLVTINDLLDNIKLRLSNQSLPDIVDAENMAIRPAQLLSSGEKELLCLAVEIIHFSLEVQMSAEPEKHGLLLLDEPDVHLHPDLQYRLISMLLKTINNLPITVVISTHSTAILAAFEGKDANVCFMTKGNNEIEFKNIDATIKDILPVFGAHPLSNIFNQKPILLVEGEDDERIWQQAVRSSLGRIKLWPCQTGSIENLERYENAASSFISSVYEDSKAFSLRDRDNNPYPIDDKTHVIRFRLNCYAVENLLLTDDILNTLDSSWADLQTKINEWLSLNDTHPKHASLLQFSQDFDRRNFKVKGLEVTFLHLLGKSKPWEVIIGQAIANLNPDSSHEEGSLVDFLGPKIVDKLNLCA